MSFIEEVRGSITNWPTYSGIVFQKTGRTLRYFFLLFTILFLITGTKTAIGLNAELQRLAGEFRANVPDFSLQNGEFSFSGEQPFIVEGTNNSALIIDTTGETTKEVLDNYIDGVYITKDRLYLKQQNEVTQFNFSDFKQTRVNKEKVVSFLPKLKWFIPVIMLIGYITQVAGKMLSGAFLAFLGMFINNSRKGNLKFRQLWNVAIYALTLPLILEALIKLIYPQLPYFFMVYYLIAIVYVTKAVRYIIDDTNIIVDGDIT